MLSAPISGYLSRNSLEASEMELLSGKHKLRRQPLHQAMPQMGNYILRLASDVFDVSPFPELVLSHSK